tara:strand:+ start:1140 stop:2084 length:945 start_codon:yes stop_codon:yes gene_type:complete
MLNIDEAFEANQIAFGGASLSGEGGGYGFGSMSETQSTELVQSAFDKNYRIFDTAPIYGFGLSEQRLGKAIKNYRDQVFVVSKCGIDWDHKKSIAIRNDVKTTKRMIDESLKRLDDDCIDLYMVHWPDEDVDIRHTLDVLTKAQAQNKIRFIGLCNTNLEELNLAKEVAKIDVVQNQLNVFENSSCELFDELKKTQIKFMSWGTLDKGIITGSVNRSRIFDKDDVRASEAPWWNDDINLPKIEKMERVLPFLKEHGHSGLEFALSFNLSRYNNSGLDGVCLCGAKSKKHLEDLGEALDNPVSSDLIDHIQRELM